MRKNLLYLTTKMFGWIMLLVSLMAFEEAKATDVTIETAKSHYEADKTFQSHYGEENVNVTLSGRSFTSNQLDGVCFPFTATADVIKNTLGDGVVIYELSSVEGSTFTFTPKADASVVAGVPYLVKPSQNVTDPVFNGVQLANTIDDSFLTHTLSTSDFAFRGYYFLKYQDVLYDSSNAHTFYYLDTDGTFKDASTSGVWKNGWTGSYAYFYVDDKTKVPTITISGSGSGGGSGGGEEGGDDPVDPSTMTLQQKINARMQLSDAPTIYIDLPDIGNTTLGEYLYKKGGQGTKADDAPYRRASIKVVATDDTTSPHYMESFEEDADHLEIKVRGNSTALEGGNNTQGKRAYRLKFAKKDKTTGKNFKHDMINGGYSKRNWALLANVMDHSMLRNAVTCELGKLVGMPFNPGYKFVDLVINNDYRGTYQVTDHPEVDGDRINVNEDTGWYVEFQGQQKMCDYPMFVSSPYYINIKNPEPTADEETESDLYATQMQEIKDAVSAWFGANGWQKGFGDAFTDPQTGWRAYNDEETLMNWWIVTEITGDYDGMMTVKAYREADGKLHWGPVWDKDLAYGNYNGSNMGTATGSLVKDCSNSTDYMKTIFAKFAADPEFMLKVKTKMDALVTAGLKNKLCDKIDVLAANIAGTEALNYGKWGYTSPQAGVDEQYHAGVDGYDNYAAYVTQLKNWINARVDYVQEQFTQLSNTANTPVSFKYDVTSVTSSDISSKMSKLVNATVENRTFTNGKWNTISLPFSVSEEKLKTAFGDDYELKEFVGVEDGTKLLFQTPDNRSIRGGYPYLIKPSKDVVSPLAINNVIVIANEKGWADNFNYGGNSVAYGDYEFVAHLTHQDVGGRMSIDENLELHSFEYGAANASLAFVRVKNNAGTPTIVILNDDPTPARTQLTNLPTVYIDTKDGAAINPSTGDYVSAAIEVMDANGTLTPFTETDEFLEIRGRGKAEWAVDGGKKSYRLKFAKKHKYDLTGAGYTKRNWVLAANAADESLIKNALTKKLGDQIGLPFTPNTCFVDLVVNGVYLGTYTAMDFVEADREDGVSRRVDADESTGWLLELVNEDGVDKTGDVYLSGTNFNSPWVVIKNPEPNYKKTDTDEVKNAAIEAVKTPVQTFISNLWTAPETYVDKSSLVNWYIASEILGGAQTLSSVYAYKDAEDSELKFGPLWGNELSWQNGSMADLNNDETKNGLIVNSATESSWRNKLQSLWSESWFKSAVVARWLEVKTGLADILKTQAETLKTTISSSWTKNYTAVASNGAGWTASGTLDSDVNTIKTYIDDRIAYLDKKFLLSASSVDYDVTRDDAITYYSQYNNKTVNVNLKNRGTFWGGEWNAICLPFNLDNTTLKEKFGNTCQLKEFTSVVEGDESNTFNFNTVSNEIVACKPYIIMPDNNVSDLSFSGVTFNVGEPQVVSVTSDKNNTFKFTGTLQPHKMPADGTEMYIGRNNKAYRSAGTMHGCRAYFTMPSVSAASKGFSFAFDESTTGVTNIFIDGVSIGNPKIYNLNGQMVGTSWETLPRGVYVINGKKIVK